MIALQPIPFHKPHANICSHTWLPPISMLTPSNQIPAFTIKLLINPSVEKMQKAIAYTSTQLMKFGTVVSVCTTRRNFIFLISQRKIANAIGSQLVKIPSPLIASVFFRTRMISLTVAGFLNNCVNHLNPTKLALLKVSPTL